MEPVWTEICGQNMPGGGEGGGVIGVCPARGAVCLLLPTFAFILVPG